VEEACWCRFYGVEEGLNLTYLKKNKEKKREIEKNSPSFSKRKNHS